MSALSDENVARLTAVFRDLFNDDTIVLSEHTTAADIPGWDSFNHINLVMMVENEFGIRLKTSEITHLKNVGGLMNLIATKVA
ncbi:acyl carrier protein [Rhizobium sp. BK377]|uniref:acyl carrier protein n=1 Tax=Rhizobium sp. BK377 TaxID=2587058 RepID=UPI00160AF269|nr:acyl carrier protein [Rhizobium sp. BK377]MBB3463086.1 acyl carrier protein [Rhizobium sp. BK377]